MESVAQGVLSGVGQMFLVALIGFIGRLLGIIGEETLRQITRITIAIFLPCFLFEAVLRDFSWAQMIDYQIVVLAALITAGVGVGLAWVGARAMGFSQANRRTTMAMCGFNNSLNIPLPLVLVLLAPRDAGIVIVLFTIYNLIWNPLIWSVGVWLVSDRGGGKGWWRAMITPPGVAIVLGILAKLPGVNGVIEAPQLGVVHDAVRWTGETAIPLALITLGGILGGMLRRFSVDWRVIGLTTVVKLFIIPGLSVLALRMMPGLDSLVVLALMIQAASPPATNLIIIAEHYGGDRDTIGATLVVTYALSVLTFVLWLSVISA